MLSRPARRDKRIPPKKPFDLHKGRIRDYGTLRKFYTRVMMSLLYESELLAMMGSFTRRSALTWGPMRADIPNPLSQLLALSPLAKCPAA